MAKGRILLIDDEPGVREFLKDYFEDREYDVDIAEDGLAGVEAFKKATYDLVVSDMLMPKMIGLEVLRNIKAINPDQKVIMMSGVKEDSMMAKAKDLGCKFYINKPVRMAEVEERIQECFQQ